jgi:hypothetical protein
MKGQVCLKLALLITVGGPSVLWSQAEVCTPVDSTLQARIAEIQANYEGVLSNKKAEVEAQAKRLEDDAPNADGAVGNVKIEVKWVDQEVILDLPATKLTDKKIVVDVPSVTMKDQSWIFDVPVVKMEPRKVGQHPEVTCESKRGGPPFYLPGYECITRWKDNIMHVPVTYMERRTVVVRIPEFTMARQEFIVGVPEFFMNQQKWILRMPQVTAIDIEKKSAEFQKRAEDFGATAGNEMRAVASAMQGEIEAATIEMTSTYFDCQRTLIARSRDQALAEFDAASGRVTAGLAASAAGGGEKAVADLRAKVAELEAQRKIAIAGFEKALADLDTTQKEMYKPKGALAGVGAKPAFRYRHLVLPFVK